MNKKASVKENMLSFLQLHEDDTVQIGKDQGQEELGEIETDQKQEEPRKDEDSTLPSPSKIFKRVLSREASDPASPALQPRAPSRCLAVLFLRTGKAVALPWNAKAIQIPWTRKTVALPWNAKAIQIPWEGKAVALPWEGRVLRKLRSWMSWI
jgi:hypothetical protein